MAQHIDEEKKKVDFTFEKQQRSFPTILEVKSEKEDVDNKEAITLMNGG